MSILQNRLILSLFIVIVFVVGCSEKSKRNTKSKEIKGQSIQVLHDLEATSGMKFSSNTVILSHSEGGRENSGYYEWLIFSRTPLVLPEIKEANMPHYLKMPLEDSVRFIESRMPGKSIMKPVASIASDWKTGRYRFRATLVNAQEGDYVIIMRFTEPSGTGK